MFGLSFLNAGILFAVIATILPLLIHLFIKNKPIKIYFSSLKFLREIIEEKKKKMTLNQLLLLILRMLIILFTIFAVSRPVLKLPFINKSNFHPPTAVAFILDTSPSMDYVIDQKTQIQHGLDIIRSIQDEMNNRDASLLLTSNALSNSINSRLVYGTLPERDFQNIEFTWTPEPLDKLIIHAQNELEKTRFLHQEIYVISDMQETELPQDINVPISFISTFTDSLRINFSIENLNIRKEFIGNSLQRIAEFDVVNYSPLSQRDQVLRLHLNGTNVSEKMIDLLPYERKTDYFIINNESLNWNSGWVEIRNDRFLPDNRYYFTFYSDPEPKIGVVTDIPINETNRIPRHIEVLSEIFLGEHGRIEYIPADNIQLMDHERYHFLIFNLSNYSSRITALTRELRNQDIKSLFLLNSNINDEGKRFFMSQYGIDLTNLSNRRNYPVTVFNRWHRIIGDFDFATQLNLMAASVFNINLGINNSSIVNTDITPLIIENNDIFVNIDFSLGGQNFLSHLSFPIIIYRSFSWISKYDGDLNQYLIGDSFRHNQGLLTSPRGTQYDTAVANFRFTEPGIWTFTDINGNNSFIAVNMFDYENQSKHNPLNISELDSINYLGINYEGNILTQDRGNEIWKILLWIVLVLVFSEMIIVLFLQKKAAVNK